MGQQHTYQADWHPGSVTFSIDGETTRVCEQAPDYPMMLILGLFDFPDEPVPSNEPEAVPQFRVHQVVGTDLGPGSIVHR